MIKENLQKSKHINYSSNLQTRFYINVSKLTTFFMKNSTICERKGKFVKNFHEGSGKYCVNWHDLLGKIIFWKIELFHDFMQIKIPMIRLELKYGILAKINSLAFDHKSDRFLNKFVKQINQQKESVKLTSVL
ncbi:hypothetical protein BpHYR1_036021 [Brachionus plicatilis]|uniref:Uncharacterized protein n=1 Tax=Brachionus plicatilis TaxID=10195 RepID=A0A3M7SXL0_BRAPC|nr:hypothetical protein BpHYR1_036021 [Brachionus plicatilis]